MTKEMNGTLDLSRSSNLNIQGFEGASSKGVMSLMAQKAGVPVAQMTPAEIEQEIQNLKKSLGEQKFEALSNEIDQHIPNQQAAPIVPNQQQREVISSASASSSVMRMPHEQEPKPESKPEPEQEQEQEKEQDSGQQPGSH